MNSEQIAKLDKLHEAYCKIIAAAERKEESSNLYDLESMRKIKALREEAEIAWRKYEAFKNYLKRAGLYG